MLGFLCKDTDENKTEGYFRITLEVLKVVFFLISATGDKKTQNFYLVLYFLSFFKHSIFYLCSLKWCSFPGSCCRHLLPSWTVWLYVCVGVAPLYLGWEGVGGSGGSFERFFGLGFFFLFWVVFLVFWGFFVCLGDTLNLSSGIVLCFSCPLCSTVSVIRVKVLEGRNLCHLFTVKKAFFCSERHKLIFFLMHFLCFWFCFFF